MRIIVDAMGGDNAPREIVKGAEYWLLDALLDCEGGSGSFSARFFGKGDKKTELKSEDEVNAVIAATQDAPFVIETVKRGQKQKSPAPPFITSTLQQEASRRLAMTPRRTMSIAQLGAALHYSASNILTNGACCLSWKQKPKTEIGSRTRRSFSSPCFWC